MNFNEKVVLGGLMHEKDSVIIYSDRLNTDLFTCHKSITIFNTIISREDNQLPIDPVSVADELGETWLSTLLELVSIYLKRSLLEYHLNLLTSELKSKRLTNALSNGLNLIAGKTDPCEVMNRLNLELTSIGAEETDQKIRLIGSSMDEFVDDLEKIMQNKGKFIGLSTGLNDLDKSINGMQDGNLIIIAGRPGMGKSLLSMNIASHNAEAGKKVVLITLEMSSLEIQQRLVSSTANVSFQSIQDASCMTHDIDSDLVLNAMTTIKNSHFAIDDSSSMDISQLRSKLIRYAKKSNGLDLVVVDYLQLLSAKSESRFQEVSLISRELKRIAKELKCPVIALSQLSRSLESRKDKRPMCSDLRESGQLEQDADKIIFIYRDEVYNPNSNSKGLAELIIGKARNCKKSDVVCVFDGDKQKFRNATYQDYDTVDSLKNVKQNNFSDRYS